MRKKYLIILSLILSIFLFSSLTTATVTQSNETITEGQTNVWTEVGSFTILLNTSLGNAMDGNITLYKGATQITITSFSGQNNGTQTLTLPSLDGSTAYKITVKVNDSIHTTESYNFTTGNKRLTDKTEDFSSAEIVILGLILIILALGIIWVSWKEFTKGSLEFKALMYRILYIMIAIPIIIAIASIL